MRITQYRNAHQGIPKLFPSHNLKDSEDGYNSRETNVKRLLQVYVYSHIYLHFSPEVHGVG